jgi:hypothetical protein
VMANQKERQQRRFMVLCFNVNAIHLSTIIWNLF